MAADRYQVAVSFDSLLARDTMVNTLYFEDIGTSDLDGNCADLAEVFDTLWFTDVDPQIEVKVYDVGTGPHQPKGRAIRNQGVSPASTRPREVALCLSFYAEPNLPRRRGRIYLPTQGAIAVSENRPPVIARTKALELAGGLAALGGADVSWNVHSQTTGEDHEVTHAWVDDEWDTVRSRGLRPTTRSMAATGS